MSASDASGEPPEIQLRRLARWACGVPFEDLPADVVSLDDLEAKFTELAEGAPPSADAPRIIAAVFDLDRGGPVSELREAMGRRRGGVELASKGGA
jgi:hypothetical protein